MQAWDTVTTARDRTRHHGPAWTEEERALWRPVGSGSVAFALIEK